MTDPPPAASPDARGAAQSPAPKYEDLSHLVFTATSELHAELTSPKPNEIADEQAVPMEVTVGLGEGVELRVNGSVVPSTQIGKRAVSQANSTTAYTFYGVLLDPGINRVTLTPLGAHGLRGPQTAAIVYGPGKPASLRVTVQGRPVADGRTPVGLVITGIDAWGHPAVPGSTIKLTITSGDGRLSVPPQAQSLSTDTIASLANPTPASQPTAAASSSPVQSGMTTASVPLVSGGTAEVLLLPGMHPGDVSLSLDCEGVSLTQRIFLAPYVRSPMVVGLLTGGIGPVPGIPGEPDDSVDGFDSRLGRAAFYATGAVGAKASLTLAYDTASALAQTTSNGAFVDDPNARPYSTYGDASTRGDDAISQDHLYARYDEGHSQALWGQFSAHTGMQNGLGSTNILLNGADLTLGSFATQLSLFHARNETAYARQILSPTGLAVIGTLAHDDIVVGSDIVMLVSLDRKTGAFVSQTALNRNVDYTLDYDTGAIRFINVPMPYDANFNPQQVLIGYEYQGSGIGAQTNGGRFETNVKNVRFGLGYLNDTYGTGNQTVFSQYVRGDLRGGAWSLEHVSSSGSMQTSVGSQAMDLPAYGNFGEAFAASYHKADPSGHFTFDFSSTSPGYNNPFGGLSAAGLTQYAADFMRKLDQRGSQFELNVDHEQNDIAGSLGSSTDASAKLHEVVSKRLNLTAAVTTHSQTVEPQPAPSPEASASTTPASTWQLASGTTLEGEVGAEYKVAPHVNLTIDHSQNISGSDDVTPDQTNAQLNFDSKTGRLFVRELWTSTPVGTFATSTQPLASGAQSTHTTEFGYQQTVGQTTFSSDYSVAQTGNSIDITSALGADQHFSFGKTLRGDIFFQHGDESNAADTDSTSGVFNDYRTTLSYAPTNGRLRATGSFETRTGESPGSTLQFGAAGAISPTLSLLGDVISDHTESSDTNIGKLGLAYRPALSDDGATLLQYERNDGESTTGSVTDTLSLDHLIRPTSRLEFALRYAYKLDGDNYYAAHSSLLGMRITQRIGSRFDIAGEVDAFGIREIAASTDTAEAVEAGLRLGDSIRFGFGYNLTSSPDPELAAAPAHRGPYLTLTSIVDNVFGWGTTR
jgi:hypothetical protein